jgi:uncharacterized protein (DUF433 family)
MPDILLREGRLDMMTTLLETGIYTVPEATRLSGVSPWRIRRWLRGYEFPTKRGRHRSQPVWSGQLEPLDHSMAVGFLDMLEIRCVNAFLVAGVGWKTMRLAHKHAQEVLKLSHPFCTNQFKVLGREIILELPQDDTEPQLWEIARNQRVFGNVTRPFLENLAFAQGALPSQWWPLGTDHLVVLDPRRSFGQPIVSRGGVPTVILRRAVKAAGSVREVAVWYDVDRAEVKDAIAFEEKLAA